MRVALNGYFWDRPRTGSGQYLRHLWNALSDMLSSPDNGAHELVLLRQGPGGEGMSVSGGRSGIPTNLTPVRKLLWEEWGAMAEARRGGAQLLHVPYLSAPLWKKLPVVVTAH